MQRDLEAYLWDISHSVEQINAFIAGLTIDDYLANELVQSAVERKFEIIGEAIKQANHRFREGSIRCLRCRTTLAFVIVSPMDISTSNSKLYGTQSKTICRPCRRPFSSCFPTQRFR